MAEKFKCDRWRSGQECKPYYTSPWPLRALVTAFGVFIALVTPGMHFYNTINQTAPAAPLQVGIIIWASVLVGAGVAGFFLSMHHEKDVWWCFLSGLGLPSLFVALINLPQLALPH